MMTIYLNDLGFTYAACQINIALVTTQLGNYLLNFLRDDPGEFNSLMIDLQLITRACCLNKIFLRSTNKLTETFVFSSLSRSH